MWRKYLNDITKKTHVHVVCFTLLENDFGFTQHSNADTHTHILYFGMMAKVNADDDNDDDIIINEKPG